MAMNWLNYHHLYYFRCIAKEGGIAKAAAKLLLGQPTLSTQLKQFEANLGQKLFDRKNRKLYLTEAGKITLQYADQIFGLGNELMQVLRDETMQTGVALRLGALDSVPKSLVSKLTNKALEKGAGCITIVEGKMDELYRELSSHQLDLLLSNHPPVNHELGKTYSRCIAKLPVAIFGTKDFLHLRKKFPQSLSQQPFILPTIHSKLRYDLDHFFNLHQIKIRPVAETQDTSLQKILGVRGLGLIPLPEFSAKELTSNHKLVKIGILREVMEEFFIIAPARKIENPVASFLMKKFCI